MPFPLEFFVISGVPVSQAASVRSKDGGKEGVAVAARAVLVERLWIQKFEPHRAYPVTATPVLADALERDGPVVYIRINDDVEHG
ncbi:MAG TPA: hypothetical protein VGD36_12195, partial [Xanthobacteraceae bacterium]